MVAACARRSRTALGRVAKMRTMKLVAVLVSPEGTAQTRDPTCLLYSVRYVLIEVSARSLPCIFWTDLFF